MPRKIKEKIHFIYKTTNIVNGKYYIGMHTTTDVNDDYLGSGKRLYYSIKKYGKENFVREILEYCNSREELSKREKEIVNEDLIKKDECLNLREGGDGRFLSLCNIGVLSGKIHANKLKTDKEYYDNHCKRASDTIKKSHKEGKFQYGKSFKDKHHTEETKLLMSNKAKERKGDKNSQFGTCWITNEIENKKINKNELIPDGWKLGRKMN